MAHIAFTCPTKIWEQTVAAQKKRTRGARHTAQLFGLWRRACMAIAEWDSRALQRERLVQLNDHLLADVGLMREQQAISRPVEAVLLASVIVI